MKGRLNMYLLMYSDDSRLLGRLMREGNKKPIDLTEYVHSVWESDREDVQKYADKLNAEREDVDVEVLRLANRIGNVYECHYYVSEQDYKPHVLTKEDNPFIESEKA
jgi:hypothetical protein